MRKPGSAEPVRDGGQGDHRRIRAQEQYPRCRGPHDRGSGLTRELAPLVLEKLREQVERLDHLLALIPPGALTSAALPIRNAMPLDLLLGHLLECLAGVNTKARAAYCRADLPVENLWLPG